MVTKIFLFILIFAALNLLREAFSFYISYRKGELKLSGWRLLGIGLSIAYILTIIITGFGI